MQTQIDAIFSKLENIHLAICHVSRLTENDIGLIKADISNKLTRGWNESEIISYLKNMEEIDPTITEDIALRLMGQVKENVAIRHSLGRMQHK
jgi:hypothetical protein